MADQLWLMSRIREEEYCHSSRISTTASEHRHYSADNYRRNHN